MTPEQMDRYLSRFPEIRLAVIGDVILDHYIWGDVARISPEAPVPLVDVSHESHRLGGAANVALNLRTLGSVPSLLGRIGEDEAGRVVKGLLAASQIEWMGDAIPPAKGTIMKTRVVARQQQLCRLDREGRRTDYDLHKADLSGLMERICEQSDGILLSDYAKGLIDNFLLEQVRRCAERHATPLFCDPKPRYGRDFSGMRLMTPNRGEAVALSGIDWDPKDPFPSEAVVGGIYRRFNPDFLVVTLGGEGMLYAENGKTGGIVPTFAQEVFDVSGAGDTVIAALSLSLLAGASLEEAVRIANTAAGVVVGKLGTATVNCSEISAFAADHGSGA